MATEYIHIEAKRSWLNGTATTLCGLTYKSGEYHTVFLFSARSKCPTCKARAKASRR